MACKSTKWIGSWLAQLTENVVIDPKAEKETRVNIWNITADDIANTLKEFSSSKLNNDEKIPSKRMVQKLERNLKSMSEFKSESDAFISKLSGSDVIPDDNVALRNHAIALDMVMETVKGEVNKAENNNLELSKISNESGLPYIPAHRLAATIGRKILYTQQLRIRKEVEVTKDPITGKETKTVLGTPTDVELAYYMAGMTALEGLAKKGFVEITESNNLQTTIKDYSTNINAKPNYEDNTTSEVKAIGLNPEAFGAKDVSRDNKDPIVAYLKNDTKSNSKEFEIFSKSYLSTIKSINMLSVPVNKVMPATSYKDLQQFNTNKYTPTGTLAETKAELESNPLMLQESIHNFLKVMHKELKNSTQNASSFIKDSVLYPETLKSLFKVDSNNVVTSDSDSFSGRNISKTSPIDDIVEYFETYDGDTPVEMYMALFGGANTRLNYDNNIINPHSSKMIRNAMAVKEYSLDIESEAFDYFVNKVSLQFNKDPDLQETMVDSLIGNSNGQFTDRINDAIKKYDSFEEAATASEKINRLTQISINFPHMEMAELLSTVKAAKDIRESISTGTLKTTYAVASDATASGGQLTLMQALGSNPENIQKVLQQLGVFKGDESIKPLKDIYKILENKINMFFDGTDPDAQPDPDPVAENNTKKLLKRFQEDLFDNDLRELSKPPTMTLIYGQSATGAKHSLGKTIADKIVARIGKENQKKGKFKLSDNTKVLLDSLVPHLAVDGSYETTIKNNENFKVDLVNGIIDSNVPTFLYKSLTQAITDTYLKPNNDMATKVFSFIDKKEFSGMRMFPASVVVDSALKNEDLTYSKESLESYGVTLSKIFEVMHRIDDDTEVLTREEKIRKTVMMVSLIHSADAANMYGALNGLPAKYDNSGVVVVHDEARSRADLMMEFDKNYTKTNLDVAMNFDILEQVLLAADAYDNSLNSNADYTKLLREVQAAKKVKQEILGDKDNGYNLETGSIIGDKLSVRGVSKRANSQPAPASNVSQTGTGTNAKTSKASKKSISKETTDSFNQKSAEEVLQDFSPKSEIITDFLNSSNKAGLSKGDVPAFIPETDDVVISTTDTRGSKEKPVKNEKKLIELIEHEIVHSFTAGYISRWLSDLSINNNELSYIDKAYGKLLSVYTGGNLSVSDKTNQRLDYMLNSTEPKNVQMAEFISVMSTEPKVAAEVYQALNTLKSLESFIQKVIKKVKQIIKRPTANDLNSSDIDPELLYGAINSVIQDGKAFRESQSDLNAELQKQFGSPLFAGPTRGTDIPVDNTYISYINNSMVRYINDPALRYGKNGIVQADNWVRQVFPSYEKAMNRAKGIYDNSEAMKSLVHKITNDNINNAKKNELLSMHSAIKTDNLEIVSKELQRFKKVTKGLDESQMKDFFDFSTKMSMADYFMFAEGVTDVDAEIKSMLKAGEIRPEEVTALKSVVDLNVNGTVVKNTKYNVEEAGFSRGGVGKKGRKMLALLSIQSIGEAKFNSMLENKELTQVLKDNVLASQAIIEKTSNLQNLKIRDSKVTDEYSEPITFKTFPKSEARRYENQDKTEWVVVRDATANDLGIAYRKVIDATYQEGIFTGLRMQTADVPVNDKFKNMNGVVKVGKDYRFIIPQEIKEKSGLLKDPSQALVRTMAHNMAIKDSEVIRNKLLEKDSHWDIKENGVKDLISIIKDSNRDNPWFLNDVKDADFNKLPAEIKANYRRVAPGLSDIGGFDKKIEYVRKDIAYWLVGSSEPSIFKSKKMQWAMRITKNLVSGTKIGMVVLNPAKIAIDNVSNVSYLMVMGLNPMEIQRGYRSVLGDFNEYRQLRNDLNTYRMRSYSSDAYKSKIESIEKRLKAHPGNGFVERGFINSLGSEIVMNADDPSSGFKADIDFVLKKVFTEKGERNNKLADFIMKASKFGINLEELLETWSPVFGTVRSGKEMESSLNDIAERIKDIKTEDQIVDYIHQYINSPNSEFVKLGTHMTDLSDVAAKETYYRYLVNSGIDSKKAEIEVIDSFPDYKEGLPTNVKQLSDMGILMFPSYWIRIQKAIYRMLKNKPVSFGTELAIQDYLEINSAQIWDQNIISKSQSFFGLVHTPWDNLGVGSIVPTNVL